MTENLKYTHEYIYDYIHTYVIDYLKSHSKQRCDQKEKVHSANKIETFVFILKLKSNWIQYFNKHYMFQIIKYLTHCERKGKKVIN